jgi:hypothetical protein
MMLTLWMNCSLNASNLSDDRYEIDVLFVRRRTVTCYFLEYYLSATFT